MRVVATTVVRESIRGKQKTGWIYDVDWTAQTVLRKLPVEEPRFPESDDNPRGGVRGGRGVAATDRGIVVANYDTLVSYDDDWNVIDSLSHPLFVGLHEIDWDGTDLWAAATGIDLVLRVSADGDVEAAWDPHQGPIRELYGLRARPAPVDGSVDYRRREAPLIDQCHVNGVARLNGSVVVNCGLVRQQKPAAARLTQRVKRRIGLDVKAKEQGRHSGRSVVVGVREGADARVLLELEKHDFPSHNGQLLDESRLAVNDSTHNVLRIFSAEERRPLADVAVPGRWLRGLEPVDAGHVLVGTAPAALALVDLERGEVDRMLQLSDDPNEAIHGLTVVSER